MLTDTRNKHFSERVYYASGVPMAQSWGKDRQPYLYNGKEFVEAHDYNTYDYGFRGYYATIGRFTSIDPLTEQTPWQSPYAYAGNNFTNAIMEYVPRSYQTNYRQSWIPYSSIDGNIHWQFSCGMFMVLAIEIIYQNQTPNNDN